MVKLFSLPKGPLTIAPTVILSENVHPGNAKKRKRSSDRVQNPSGVTLDNPNESDPALRDHDQPSEVAPSGKDILKENNDLKAELNSLKKNFKRLLSQVEISS